MVTEISEIVVGGLLGGLIALGIAVVILLLSAVYIYFAIAWMTIAKRMKYKKAWLAWIPIANLSMILQLGRFHWAWIFLVLIPFLGWLVLFVMVIIATWRIFENMNYPGWFSLSLIIPEIGWILYGVVLGFVAWRKKYSKKKEKVRKQVKRKARR